MWQRFTERARRVVYFAQEDARKRGLPLVDTEHLLIGVLQESADALTASVPGAVWPPPPKTWRGQHSLGYQMFAVLNIAPADVQAGLVPHLKSGDKSPALNDMKFSPASKRVIDLAYDEARRMRHNYIGAEHILLGLIRDKVGVAGQVLAALGADIDRAREVVSEMQGAGTEHGMETSVQDLQNRANEKPAGSWFKTLFGRK